MTTLLTPADRSALINAVFGDDDEHASDPSDAADAVLAVAEQIATRVRDEARERVESRAWAEAFLAEWSRPYFGEDRSDAVACVMRAARAASATGPTEGQTDD